jgi:predicted  nucleic acid-binding Zn-ribbon protein
MGKTRKDEEWKSTMNKMQTTRTSMPCLGAFGLLLALGACSGEKAERTDPAPKVVESVGTERDALIDRAQEHLRELDDKMATLEGQISGQATKAQVEALARLRKARDDAENALTAAKEEGTGSWAKVRASVEETLDRAQAAYEAAEKEAKGQTPKDM